MKLWDILVIDNDYVKIDAFEVSEYCKKYINKTIDLGLDYTNIRIPFPKMIINDTDDKDYSIGWVIDREYVQDENSIINAVYYNFYQGNKIVVPMEIKTEKFVPYEVKFLGVPNDLKTKFHEMNTEDKINYLLISFSVLFTTIQFLNCKNVKKVEQDPNKILTRQVKRQMQRKNIKPFKKYYTLEIEPMKEVLKTEGSIEHNGLKKSFTYMQRTF